MARKIQSDAQENIDTLKELESQYEAYGYYLQAVQRDGVPYNLITKALPLIEVKISFSYLIKFIGSVNSLLLY